MNLHGCGHGVGLGKVGGEEAITRIYAMKKDLCMFLLTANGDHQRKQELDTMQRSLDCGEFSLNGSISVIAPILWFRRHDRRPRKSRIQKTRKSALKESVLEVAEKAEQWY